LEAVDESANIDSHSCLEAASLSSVVITADSRGFTSVSDTVTNGNFGAGFVIEARAVFISGTTLVVFFMALFRIVTDPRSPHCYAR
jgi:hypothetical protein